MIIYGRSGAKNVQTKSIPNIPCPSCETAALEVAIYSDYAHLYWIPLFSFGKRSFVQCTSCGQEIRKKKRPLQVQNKISDLKSDFKIPIWHFSGIFLIAILLLSSSFVSRQQDIEHLSLLGNPVTGDIYELKLDYKEYTTFKILDNEKDSVSIIYNIYETNKQSGISEINKAENYTDAIGRIGKDQLAQMFEEGMILAIQRE